MMISALKKKIKHEGGIDLSDPWQLCWEMILLHGDNANTIGP